MKLNAAAIDQVLQTSVGPTKLPGIVATVCSREATIYEGAFGERLIDSGNTMTLDTVCWIASMTKAITSVCAVQCVEKGLIDLDAPASAVLPELADVQVLTGFNEAGMPTYRAPRRAISLRHLLTHSAGFSYEIWNADIQKLQAALDIPSVTTCRNKALSLPLLFDPGERWEYGINIDWAGKMVEAVSGKTLSAYMHDQLFEPLGMQSTAFRITAAMRERLSAVHLRGSDGSLAAFPFEMPQEPEFEMGGGGLYSTAGDYLKFLRMILNNGQLGGERVLKPESVWALGQNQMGDCRVTPLVAAIPLTNDAEFFPGSTKSWSLAFQVNHEDLATGRPAGGLMWAGLANSYYWIDQKTGIAAVYITQLFPFADHESLPTYLAFEAAVYQGLHA
ncbi:MAG: class A beta-lactamase-related serine hydrolase [Betaproteobacteria bacterium]|jgi:methyl acetate hydrolase|nr:class A beta-lactamase-related serine hydrolase [Betaproteobacteria bacterium]NBO94687.1 class A beta-lactamase-related serine hydrolase [Betaproteobacteria bacterium]NCW23788.1 class A beta-lactamase-related serine hydrolase [Betaproteobacteria bacterium]NDA92453.1 class A beta-lactamase-related serine hydrolase [Betaproteobacteria bacterium]NDE94285.1 class A beta-lactamase-related serine hydrolase [Betaproteobacteria bacterium]